MNTRHAARAYVATPDSAPAFWQLGNLWRVMASGVQTGDSFCLLDQLVTPSGGGPCTHKHTQDEGLYVVSGHCTFQAGGQTISAGAGTFVAVPRHTEHSFSVDAPGTQLLNFYLPAGFELFLIGISHPAEKNELPPPDVKMPPPRLVEQLSRDYGQIPVLGLPGIDPPADDNMATKPTPGAVVFPFSARADAAPAYWGTGGGLWSVLASGEQTGGSYCLLGQTLPQGPAAPPHLHDSADEVFYVLDGAVTFLLGDRVENAGRGALAFIPCGTVHGFRVDSSTVRLLNLYPPAGFERSIVELGQPAPARTLPPPDWTPHIPPERQAALFDERACGGWRSRTRSTRSSESAVPATPAMQRPCFHPAALLALALALWLAALPLPARAAGAEGADSPPEAPPRPQLSFPGRPALQASVGAAHQLALENLLVLNTIRDPKHDHNRSGLFRDPPGTFTRAGGDYQTPWTRDASINSWNANSLLAPAVAANTLWAVVERQNGKLIVQQDDQWWDQVIWIPAAWNHYLVTGDRAFLAPACEAATQTLARRREKNFNAAFGLFAGPSFFNDGISGYPPPLGDTGGKGSFVLDHPGTDKIMALSTNCVYVAAYRAAADFARELGRPPPEARDFDQKADALAAAINARLWDPDAHAYGYFLYGSGPDIGRMEKYQEGSGVAFAVLFGVADAARARSLVADAHRQPKGITSIWPNFATFSDAKPGRHNNVVWPLVNGLFAHAAATVGATGILADEIVGQANLALASKDFREIYNGTTGAVDGGWQNGDHWGSAVHQTWSASSFLRAVYLGVFGLGFERDGLRFNPRLPADWSGVQLTGLPYRAGQLDLTLTGVGTRVTGLALDGRTLPGNFIAASDLTGRHRVEITLAPQEPAAP